MSETKLTLDEAKAEIGREIAISHIMEGYGTVTPSEQRAYNLGIAKARDILARVEQPSEEDMAVLWLIREKGYVILRERNEWAKQRHPGTALFDVFNPAEEARKLGWGG